METKTMNLNFVKDKVSKVRKSCVTPEQKSVYRKYQELYRGTLARYNSDYKYQIRVDTMMLIGTGAVIALFAATFIVAAILKALNH